MTFLFTDVESSTKMWERNPSVMQKALSRHDEILRSAIEANGGYVFKTVGDAFCAAFPAAPDALDAALVAQRALSDEPWNEGLAIKAKMALHTGTVEERDGDYFGPPVNRVARLLSIANGGQVLLSTSTQELARDELPSESGLRDLGEHRLKDLFRPERIFQLGAPGLPSEFPPLRTLESRPNNLPMQPTPLVGRERETAEVADRVRIEEARLLTLTGPGGTGKTRLALQAAADLLEKFEDGVFFVALATITDPALVASAIAGPLGVKESGDQPLEEGLEAYLRDRNLLLVLDNFEQVLEGAPLVGELLEACPKLKVLATSRIPLRLYGEKEYPVPPLALPDPTVLPPLEVLTQYEAVRLFVDRARAVKADFEITNESAPAVAEICARLDGLPLAIELAAARVRLLPPQKMLQRLGNRMKLLKGGARDLPTRQQTLRGAIDWSHELLEDEDKTLFRRMAVFAGGRTLEAMEEICDPEGNLDVLEGVESLLEKSLIRQEEGPGGEPRFVMLETMHEYGREKLQQSGEAETIKRAHAEYFLELAEEAEPELVGPEEAAWLDRLEAEHDNLRGALSWSLGGGDGVLGLRLAGALGRFWRVRGHFSERRGWLEEALAGCGEAPADARARALVVSGTLAVDQGDFERAKASSQEALALYRGLGHRRGAAYSLFNIAWAELMQGNDEQAAPLVDQTLTMARESGYDWVISCALNALASIAGDRGDYERAEASYEEALASARKLGSRQMAAIVLGNMGCLQAVRGDYERAEALLEEVLAGSRELKDIYGVAMVLLNLGLVVTRRGDHERARRLLKESLLLSRQLGSKITIAECLEILSEMAGALGDFRRAARLWGAADALREAINAPWPPLERRLYEPYLAAIRSRADEALWRRSWEEGQAMTMEEAFTYALEDTQERT